MSSLSMDRLRAALMVAAIVALAPADATSQTKPAPAKPAPAKPAPARSGAKPAPAAAATAPRIELAMVNCPSVLGTGTLTARTYCDVQIGNDAAAGIIVNFPPHAGPVRLMFDLHNRHTYSAELVKSKRGYSSYTARIGVLTLNNFLLSRFVIHNEFRTEADLFDRVSGGSGPGGLKAVAPTGIEAIEIEVPEEHEGVSILGERLSVVRLDDVDTFTAAGRPMALISNVRIEYTPPPPPKPAPRRK